MVFLTFCDSLNCCPSIKTKILLRSRLVNISPALPSYNETFKSVSICVFISVNLHRHAYVEVRGKFEKWVLRIELRSSSALTHYLALQRRAMLLLLLLL